MTTNAANRLEKLARQPIQIAIDTEFAGPQTLSVQTACRLGDDELAVQVYRSALIPPVPNGLRRKFLQPQEAGYGEFFRRVILRTPRPISTDLSPAYFVRDLLKLPQLTGHSRVQGQRLLRDESQGPTNGRWCSRTDQWRIPAIQVVLIAHHLPADFARVFGRLFLADLLESGDITIRNTKRLGFVEGRIPHRAGPVVQYIGIGNNLYAIRLETMDTNLPFGPATLENHSRTFLGLGKSTSLAEQDKEDMLRTFREKPWDA